ncbi:MarR family transcriptional regulator [Bordetella genomosp. 1]|uniref:MarR family transcriptional regulator n=1 Tax=Bordetella genomosp. 1 TaxID=1395607 RepID=A0A261SEJ2_9BORD|nr:MarR family transcriptional regulator [Bordetella genomosp. 1]OZI35491.1 MarR family transcriptional regulator [Bordetella genomosp. 1]
MPRSHRSASRPPLAPADYALLSDFRYALRNFIAFSEDAATALGLTPQQHQAMLAVKGAGGSLYVGQIAERLHIKPHSAAELVSRLERQGLAERLPDAEDGRRVSVVLTGQAEHLLAELSAAHLEELRAIRPLLQRLLGRTGAA